MTLLHTLQKYPWIYGHSCRLLVNGCYDTVWSYNTHCAHCHSVKFLYDNHQLLLWHLEMVCNRTCTIISVNTFSQTFQIKSRFKYFNLYLPFSLLVKFTSYVLVIFFFGPFNNFTGFAHQQLHYVISYLDETFFRYSKKTAQLPTRHFAS